MRFSKKVWVIPVILLAAFLTMNFAYTDHSFLKTNNFQDHQITLPLGGNAWRSGAGNGGGHISNEGIEDWTDKQVTFTAYVRLDKPGNLKVALNAEVPSGKSAIEISIDRKNKKVMLSSGEDKAVEAGEWLIEDTGYIAIHINGVSKSGHVFANIQSLNLSGSAITAKTAYVKNNEGNFFLWGRRGPSVHLNFKVPQEVNVEWFYNEVTVPKGNDVLGSYFMADGFGQGYFGMQVNSPSTRHILFSVWSPYKTDNPREIPDSQKIQLLNKGDGVHAGAFGGEGSGGQSFMNYMWKAGTTYRFLLHGVPDGPDHSVFTAYFYEPENGKWHLIASFRRPKTHTYLTGLYSFLENFSPAQGDRERHVLFGNQWIQTDKGQWIELNKIRFTTDNTGRKGYRMDYAGGIKDGQFYLRNCGFFNDYTVPDKIFERPLTGQKPQINLDDLPTN